MSEFDEQSTRDLEDDASDLFNDSDSMMITDEAIAVMAGVAASEVRGVSGMSGGFAGGIAEDRAAPQIQICTGTQEDRAAGGSRSVAGNDSIINGHIYSAGGVDSTAGNLSGIA